MNASNKRRLFAEMEAAYDETRRHLDLIERQIERRATRMTVSARVRDQPFARGSASWSPADERLFRDHVEALAFQRRREIDALSRKLTRQERAIATFPMTPGCNDPGLGPHGTGHEPQSETISTTTDHSARGSR